MKIVDFVLRHKRIFGVLAIIVVAGILFRSQIKAKVAPTPIYKTATVEKKTLEKIVSASGKVKADEEVTLKFQTSGYLNWVGVKKGDYVKKWQAIAKLDAEELKKNLEKYLRDYSIERNDFEETRRVDYPFLNPGDALTNTVKRILEKNQWDLDKTVLDVEIKNLALKYATLWSPIDGVVTSIDAPFAGVNITPTTAQFTISNPNKLIFAAKVDEVDIRSVKIGQNAKIVLDAYPDEIISAQVDRVDFTATTTSSGGTAFEVKFLLPENLAEKFKIGMNGDAEIILGQEADALAIPLEAVREKDSQNYVWLLESGKPVEKIVKTGFSNDSDTQILEGVSEGQTVIISDFKTLEK